MDKNIFTIELGCYFIYGRVLYLFHVQKTGCKNRQPPHHSNTFVQALGCPAINSSAIYWCLPGLPVLPSHQ